MKQIKIFLFALFKFSLLQQASAHFPKSYGAEKGMVVVFEAPLLNRPNLESAIVLEQVKRGDIISIHPNQVPSGEIVDGPDKSGFFHTLDSIGNDAYIERRYVKIIYNDTRELATGVRPMEKTQGHDHTDYRLEEPIPENYPFEAIPLSRLELAFHVGPSERVLYPYRLNPIREDFGQRFGLVFNYASKVESDPYDRFYFGTQVHFLYQSTKLSFEEFEVRATESLGELGGGPIALYTFMKNQNHRLSISGGITLNYHRSLIEMNDSEMLESRIFTGFSLTPRFGLHYVRQNWLPVGNFLIGASAQFNLQHSLQSSDGGSTLDDFWNPLDDQITIPTGGVYGLFIGVQNTY